jgi:COMPASS component SWD1
MELIYLAAIPIPDTPDEQPDKCLGSSSKLEDSNHSDSPSSLDAVQNGQAIPPASSPMEGKVLDYGSISFQFLLLCNNM